MAQIEGRESALARWAERAKSGGPGWLLSAYTLGSGTAIASIMAGSQYQYSLLWVNVVAMFIGVMVLISAAYFTLSSPRRPYERFRTEIHPLFAYAWAIGSLIASIIWHLPQYGLAYAAIRELFGFNSSTVTQVIVGGVIVVISTLITWQYKRGFGLVIYEGLMKLFIWITVICLFVLMWKLPILWSEVARGYYSFRVPDGGAIFVFSLLGAAVGINMTFLYPYSVRNKGWSAHQAGTAMKDLFIGMFFPFVIATGMLMIAAGATLYGAEVDRSRITQVAHVFSPAFGETIGPVLFLLGLLAMPLATITLHMLTCGFIISEMTGAEQGGTAWKLGTLIPAIGVIGVAYPLPLWLPIPISALGLVLLPVAYIGFAMLALKDRKQPGAAPYPLNWFGLGACLVGIGIVIVVASVRVYSYGVEFVEKFLVK